MKSITTTLAEALEPEQPRSVSVTLGDFRRARRALHAFEALKTSPDWRPVSRKKEGTNK